MNITLVCAHCDRGFDLRDFNLARIDGVCPICGNRVPVADSVTRVFGRTIGRAVFQIVNSLQRVLDRAEDSDDSTVIILGAERKVTQILTEARGLEPAFGK